MEPLEDRGDGLGCFGDMAPGCSRAGQWAGPSPRRLHGVDDPALLRCMEQQAGVRRPIESCWATLADEVLVSGFGRLPRTHRHGQPMKSERVGRWLRAVTGQLPNGALETRADDASDCEHGRTVAEPPHVE